MNGTLESPVKVKSERGKSFSPTAEINPFFEGVFRRYHSFNNPTKWIDPNGLCPDGVKQIVQPGKNCNKCDNTAFWSCMASESLSNDFLDCISASYGLGLAISVPAGIVIGGGVAAVGTIACTLTIAQKCNKLAGCE